MASKAAPFKAPTEYNIEAGLITYNPDNAVLVRARETIDWGPLHVADDEKPPYATVPIPPMKLDTSGASTINLDQYFADDESELSYTASIILGSKDADATISDGSYLTISATGNNPAKAVVSVTATDKGYNSTAQTFDVYIGNNPPYLTSDFENLELSRNFGCHQIDLDNYFADDESDLTYSIKVQNLGAGTISASIKDKSILSITCNTTNAYAYIYVLATDNKGKSSATDFGVSVGRESIPKPYIVTEIPDITLMKGFNSFSFDLAKYFASNGNYIYYDFYAEYNDAVGISLPSKSDLLIEEKDQFGIVNVSVRALDVANYSSYTEQFFTINYGGIAPNRKPYVAQPLAEITLPSGFASPYLLDLHRIFKDKDGDALEFFIKENKNVYLSKESVVAASIENGKLLISELSTGMSFLTVTANDKENTAYLFLEINIVDEDNKKPEAQNDHAIISLEQNENIASIYLPDYFADTEKLSYTITNYPESSASAPYYIEGDFLYADAKTIGGNWITIIADDGKGGIAYSGLLIKTSNQFSIDPGIIAQLPDITIPIRIEKKIISLSKYFSNETTGYLSTTCWSSDLSIANCDLWDDTLAIIPQGIGTSEIEIILYNSSGGIATQKFNVTVSDFETSAQETIKTSVDVFPSIFTENITINGADGNTATISNMSGIVVFKSRISHRSEMLDLNHLAQGIYILNVSGETRKIIKN